jgi:DNA-binding MarR family transcriptional regulator
MEPIMAKEQSTPMDLQTEHSIVDLLHRGSQVAEDCFSRAMTIESVTPRQYTVLAAVARMPNANQTDIVNMTGIDRSTMADIVGRLVTKGLLQRSRTKEDARAYAVSLAPKAQEMMQQLSADMAKAEEVLLSALSAADRPHLIGLLKKLVEVSGYQEDERQAPMTAPGPSAAPVRY